MCRKKKYLGVGGGGNIFILKKYCSIGIPNTIKIITETINCTLTEINGMDHGLFSSY